MKSLILKDLYNIGVCYWFDYGFGGGKLYYFIGSVMQHDDCNNVYV